MKFFQFVLRKPVKYLKVLNFQNNDPLLVTKRSEGHNLIFITKLNFGGVNLTPHLHPV
jgi:hypothetical protein